VFKTWDLKESARRERKVQSGFSVRLHFGTAMLVWIFLISVCTRSNNITVGPIIF
jgi:hypothetical protein